GAARHEVPGSAPGAYGCYEACQSVARDLVRDSVGCRKASRRRSIAQRELERVGVVEADRLDSGQRLAEIVFRFTGEADNDVCGTRETRNRRLQPIDTVQ